MPALLRPDVPAFHPSRRGHHTAPPHALPRPLPALQSAPDGQLHRRGHLLAVQHQAATVCLRAHPLERAATGKSPSFSRQPSSRQTCVARPSRRYGFRTCLTPNNTRCRTPRHQIAIQPTWMAQSDRLAITIHSVTPCTSGRTPTSFSVLRVIPVPIRNSTTVNAAFPSE